MFAPGDYVIYSVEGVCLVEEAGQLNVPGLERGRSYYRLTPYYRGGVIYTPVDGKAAIRPVMTKPALQALLPELPGMPELENVPQDPASWQAFTARFLRLMTAAGSCSCARRCSTSSVSLRRSAKPSVRPSFAAGKPPRRCFIRSLPSSSACSQPRSKPIWKQHSPPEHPKSRTQGFSACGLSFFFDYLRSFSRRPLRRSAGAIAA